MRSEAKTLEEYIESLPEDRKKIVNELRKEIMENLPPGFKEEMGYGMLGYVVPHSLYPSGYHCDPKQPLPFIGMASQKNFVAVYHMGLYADKNLLDWFTSEYAKQNTKKLDMGKSCLRFKKYEHVPFKLIGDLSSKMTVADWVGVYEKNFRK